MPVDRMITYLKNNRKTLYDKIFEVYIGLVVGQAEQVMVKKENIVLMDYDNFMFYLLEFKNNSESSWVYGRSVVMFFVYDRQSVPACK